VIKVIQSFDKVLSYERIPGIHRRDIYLWLGKYADLVSLFTQEIKRLVVLSVIGDNYYNEELEPNGEILLPTDERFIERKYNEFISNGGFDNEAVVFSYINNAFKSPRLRGHEHSSDFYDILREIDKIIRGREKAKLEFIAHQIKATQLMSQSPTIGGAIAMRQQRFHDHLFTTPRDKNVYSKNPIEVQQISEKKRAETIKNIFDELDPKFIFTREYVENYVREEKEKANELIEKIKKMKDAYLIEENRKHNTKGGKTRDRRTKRTKRTKRTNHFLKN
jgi:hypothetical protein